MKFIKFFVLLLFLCQIISSCYKVEQTTNNRTNCYLDYSVDSANGIFEKYIYKDNKLIAVSNTDFSRYFDRFKDSLVTYEIYKSRSFYRFVYYKLDSNTILCKSIQTTSNFQWLYRLKNNLIDTIYEVINNQTIFSSAYSYNSDYTINRKVFKNEIFEYEYYDIDNNYFINSYEEVYKYFNLSIKLKLIKSIVNKDLNGNIQSKSEYTYDIDSTGKIKHRTYKSGNNLIYEKSYFYHCD